MEETRQIDEDIREIRSDQKKPRKEGWLEKNFGRQRQGHNLRADLTDKIRWDIFVMLSMYRNPRNVSKISADISDNALSLLKKTRQLSERRARTGESENQKRETPDTQSQSRLISSINSKPLPASQKRNEHARHSIHNYSILDKVRYHIRTNTYAALSLTDSKLFLDH